MRAREAEERVLVIAPTGRDAVAMADLINSHGFKAEICGSAAECARLVAEGTGTLLLTEEALKLPNISELLDTLHSQPPWSELPLIILTSGGESRHATLLDMVASAAGSITLLERPMSANTLSRSIQVALRSRRRQYEVRDLIEANSKLAAIVRFSEDAIISKDLDGIITSWNPGAERLFGYTSQETVGRSISIIVPSDRPDEEQNILDRILQGARFEHYETVRCRKDGTKLEVSLTISPLQNERGKTVGASQIARDISARKRAEEALRQAQIELQEHATKLERVVAERTADLRATNEQLETFIYSIAHDLRAPLRSMTGYAELLLEDYGNTLEPAGQKMLRRIQEASEFMDKLLMDLLTYGRAASAPLQLNAVEVQKAWDSALFQCAVQIENSKAAIETVTPLPRVRADEVTLGQILANLLSNALKFVPQDTQPRIRLRAELHEAWVRLWIEDNGIGIPLDQ
jgi:PAS domain S-box-containing protein